MNSSEPAMRSSASGPDGVGDTTHFIATAASYASEGPTLPIIGAAGEHTDLIRPSKATNDARPTKKRKKQNGTTKGPAETDFTVKKPDVDLAPLHNPWTLLPPELLERVEKRLREKLEERVEVVVWTKNQNVKSGINRLKALLGFGDIDQPNRKTQDEVPGGKPGGIIAVSAYGEGTTKMVGIVEMAKRVVSGGSSKKEVGGATWYAYTTLTGLNLQARQAEGAELREKSKDGEEALEQGRKDRVPILTLWFSSKSLPEFKTTFGEQTFTVVQQPPSA